MHFLYFSLLKNGIKSCQCCLERGTGSWCDTEEIWVKDGFSPSFMWDVSAKTKGYMSRSGYVLSNWKAKSKSQIWLTVIILQCFSSRKVNNAKNMLKYFLSKLVTIVLKYCVTDSWHVGAICFIKAQNIHLVKMKLPKKYHIKRQSS